MVLQIKTTNNTTGFYLNGGAPLIRDNEIIVTDGGGVAIAPYTVMGYNPTTGKWDPFTNLAATDGTAWPTGIYIGDEITAAEIQAGDVTGVSIMVGAQTALQVDESQLVFEAGTLSLASICGPNTPAAGDLILSCRQALNRLNIYPQLTQNFEQIAPIA